MLKFPVNRQWPTHHECRRCCSCEPRQLVPRQQMAETPHNETQLQPNRKYMHTITHTVGLRMISNRWTDKTGRPTAGNNGKKGTGYMMLTTTPTTKQRLLHEPILFGALLTLQCGQKLLLKAHRMAVHHLKHIQPKEGIYCIPLSVYQNHYACWPASIKQKAAKSNEKSKAIKSPSATSLEGSTLLFH